LEIGQSKAQTLQQIAKLGVDKVQPIPFVTFTANYRNYKDLDKLLQLARY
jgi:hypothetical protein